jgi:hypothetical protein
MKKNGLQLPAVAVLVAILCGACIEPFDSFNESAEHDAQGRRLVTVTVDVEKAARAVNTPMAQAYIDFYEVVFVGPGAVTEYYAAITTKGAGRRLSLRVPVGDYKGYLNAGYLESNGDAVLLAQAAIATTQPASDPWNFTLTALKLQVNGPTSPATTTATGTSKSADPIYVQFGAADAPIQMTSGGIPFYAPTAGDAVTVKVDTGVTNVIDYDTNNVAVVPLGRKSDTPPSW